MLKTAVETNGSNVTLYLEGTLDIVTIEQFQVEYENLSDIQQLEIDMEKLVFIDSTGVGALLELIYSSKKEGFTIKITNIHSEIRDVLETIGLFRVMEAIQRER